jgi:beta-galactosidase
MRQLFLVVFAVFLLSNHTLHSSERTTINLNGTWQFDQTTSAFPPIKFTRTIAVPGLIHLAEPKIADYDKFFQRPADTEIKDQHNLYDLSYKPKYSWYRKTVYIPSDMQGKEAMITIKKSQFVTQVYINGYDMGTSMACFTPVEFPVSRALKYGAENEILIKVGERVWLPSQAAGGTDKEKENYLPGIWDDLELSFTGNIRLNRILALPSVENKKVTVKAQLRNFKPAQIFYGDPMYDSVTVKFLIAEKTTGKVIAQRSNNFSSKRDNLTEVEMDIQLPEFTIWTLDNPFLYTITANLEINNKVSDAVTKQFGMRDFTRKGKFFYLNGEKIILRGSNVTLHRFFEDPDCGNLAWDREWVKKFLIDYPKELNWNMMRICVGLVPDFWYDLADEHGLLFQNEWMYWQNHGWDNQIREEYTDWVWTDGNHPSIAIWDAINENWDDYIGNTLIPELKKLDPTRIWDAGYMSGGLMAQDEMDEPHPYQGRIRELQPGANKDFYPLGKLDFKPGNLQRTYEESPAQLVNEYGWIWLWRNGIPSKLTVEIYEYYLGKNSTPEQNRELQAYWLQLETEWLRSQTSLAGVLAFCYLTNNYGYTGDWFIDNIKDLTPSPTVEWFRHAFAPAGVFINLTDERYTKELEPHIPGEQLAFNLVGVNDHNFTKTGKVHVKLFNDIGDVVEQKILSVNLKPYQRAYIPVSIELPEQDGGYTIVAEFVTQNDSPVISRRYIKVGEATEYKYYDL